MIINVNKLVFTQIYVNFFTLNISLKTEKLLQIKQKKTYIILIPLIKNNSHM